MSQDEKVTLNEIDHQSELVNIILTYFCAHLRLSHTNTFVETFETRMPLTKWMIWFMNVVFCFGRDGNLCEGKLEHSIAVIEFTQNYLELKKKLV